LPRPPGPRLPLRDKPPQVEPVQSTPPVNLVEMGYISAPFGIKGWVKVQSYAGADGKLADYPTWWLGNESTGWREVVVEQSQLHGVEVVAKLASCDDRDVAAGLKGQTVAVPRAAFPAVQEGEYYWADLVGLSVRNSEGLDLGVVTSMLETGANAVMVVRQVVQQDKQQYVVDSGQGMQKKGERQYERLIPFIAPVIKRVDMAASLIEVDWGADF
jgi:16S rRNA processing protein RimM